MRDLRTRESVDTATHFLVVFAGVGQWAQGDVVSLAEMFQEGEAVVRDLGSNKAETRRFMAPIEYKRLLELEAIVPCDPPPDCACGLCRGTITLAKLEAVRTVDYLSDNARIWTPGHEPTCKCPKCNHKRSEAKDYAALVSGKLQHPDLAHANV